jgi:hypothetical protein
MLAGHRAVDIAVAIGTDAETVRDVSRGDRRWVHLATVDAVRALCHRWADRTGSSPVTAARARRSGYVSVAAWDDIDDPGAIPNLGGEPDPELVDEERVLRALRGFRTELTDAELVATIRAGIDRGHTFTRMCDLLSVNRTKASRLLAEAAAREALAEGQMKAA